MFMDKNYLDMNINKIGKIKASKVSGENYFI